MKIKTCILTATIMVASSVSAEGIALQPAQQLSTHAPAAATHSKPNKPAASNAHSTPNATNSRSNSSSTAVAETSSRGGSAQGVGSQGQSTSVDNHATSAAATAVAPALVSSNDTCMGSSAIGASGLSFGVSVGSTFTDNNCVMLKNAREIWNMGFKGAALARLCMDDLNKEALEASGINCPERKRANASRNTRGAKVVEIDPRDAAGRN